MIRVFKYFTLPFAFLLIASRGLAQSPEPTPTPSPTPQLLGASPDGKFLVRREQAESDDLGRVRKSIEICSNTGKVLYSWTSGLGSTSFLWSPDGEYLAVNDMPGDAGDLVKVFHLDPEKPTVIPVRNADGKKLLQVVESRQGNFFIGIEKVQLRAQEWREGHLWCLLTGVSHAKRQSSLHAPFHHLWVFEMKGDEEPILTEDWTRSEPKEQLIKSHEDR